MKCIILAAGYATRLYPLTENSPKALLEVKGKTVLEWLLENASTMEIINEYIVIANHRFAKTFIEWANQRKERITVIDDGTNNNEERLGAIKDLSLAIDMVGYEDCLVLAGDNLLDFSLSEFVEYAKKKGTSCVMRYFEEDRKKLMESGVVTITDDDLIIGMAEKPTDPKSNWCCPPFYYYKNADIKLIHKGIADGCSTDSPGGYVAWLCKNTPVHAMQMPGKRFDIGGIESYRQAQEEYNGIQKRR